MNVYIPNKYFEADTIFAVAALKLINKKVDVVMIDNASVTTCESDAMLVNIGDKHDHIKHFDPNAVSVQPREDGHLFSAFGLVWNAFGLLVCEGNADIANFIRYHLVDGIDWCLRHKTDAGDITREYKIPTLTNMFSFFNDSSKDDECDYDGFIKAVEVAQVVINNYLKAGKEWFSFKQTMEKSIDEKAKKEPDEEVTMWGSF